MRHFSMLVLAATSLGWLACGGAPPKPTTSTLPIATATASAAPAVDLSPVAMPDSVVVLVHVAHPSASADVISDWAGQPLDAQPALAEMVGERIAKVVDLDSPADLVVVAKDRGGDRDPDISFAVALPVKNFDAAKAALSGDYGLLPIDNGAFEVQRSGGHRHEGDRDFRSCALAPAIAGARVVCSRNATSRDAMLPYLTRGTAAFASQKSDFHLEARPGPFRALVDRNRDDVVARGSRKFGGGAMGGAVGGAIADVIDGFLEADKATVDVNVDAKHGSAQLTIATNGSRALVTRLLTAHPERAEAPPASFFRLPSDADVALFEHGLDADQIAGPKETLLRAVDAELDNEPRLKQPDRKAIADALDRTFELLTMPAVYARGVDIAKAVPAVSGLTEASDAAKIRAGAEQAAGWDVFGVEAPADKIAGVLKAWAGVVARPAVAAVMGKDTPKFRVTAAPRGAPAGTVALALTVTHEEYDWSSYGGPKSKPKKKPPIVLTLHTLIVPDHTTAWVVNALDEATAVAKARALVAGSSGTLAGRAGLGPLKAARANAGGFVTPRGLGLGLPLTWLFGSPRYKVTSDPLLGISSPTQYTTPLVFTASEGAAGASRTVTLGAEIPRAALADFLAVGPRIFH